MGSFSNEEKHRGMWSFSCIKFTYVVQRSTMHQHIVTYLLSLHQQGSVHEWGWCIVHQDVLFHVRRMVKVLSLANLWYSAQKYTVGIVFNYLKQVIHKRFMTHRNLCNFAQSTSTLKCTILNLNEKQLYQISMPTI